MLWSYQKVPIPVQVYFYQTYPDQSIHLRNNQASGMFRQFSKIGIFLQLIVVVVIAIVLLIPLFINPQPISADKGTNPLFTIIDTLIGDSFLIKASIAVGIIGFIAFFLFMILISHDMHPKDSLLPVLYYFLLAFGLTKVVSFGPALLALIFLMISLFLILRIYGSNEPYKQVFSASFCISIAALFYPPAFSFMLFIWLSFLTYRIASWREWAISVIGALVPLLYLITYYYWVGQLPEIMSDYFVFFCNPLTQFPDFSLWQKILLVFVCGMFLLTLFRQIILIQEKLISIRRKTWIFIDFMIVAAFSSLLSGTDLVGHFAIIAIPGALFLSNSVTGKKASLPYELFSAIFIILLIFARMSA